MQYQIPYLLRIYYFAAFLKLFFSLLDNMFFPDNYTGKKKGVACLADNTLKR